MCVTLTYLDNDNNRLNKSWVNMVVSNPIFLIFVLLFTFFPAINKKNTDIFLFSIEYNCY